MTSRLDHAGKDDVNVIFSLQSSLQFVVSSTDFCCVQLLYQCIMCACVRVDHLFVLARNTAFSLYVRMNR